MHILVATPLSGDDIGGPASHVRLIAEELPRYDCVLSVVSFRDVRHLPKGIRHVVYVWRVFVRSKHVDLIYALDGMSVGFPATIAARLRGKKLIIRIPGIHVWEQAVQRMRVTDTLDEFIANQHTYGLRIRMWLGLSRWIVNRAQKIIVPSEYLKKITELLGTRVSVCVVYSAFDPGHAGTGFNVERKANCLISAGRLVSWKGMKTLIAAFKEVQRVIPDAQLVIIGDGPEQEALKKQTTSLGLESKVTFTGSISREEVTMWLLRGNIFVLNTGYEGLSHQILEAMNAGIPVITTSVGGNPELIENGKNGILVGYNDEQALVTEITQLLKDDARIKAIAQEAKNGLSVFAKQKIIPRLYRELTNI